VLSRKAINLNYFFGLILAGFTIMIMFKFQIGHFILPYTYRGPVYYNLSEIGTIAITILLTAICWWRGGLVHIPKTFFSSILLRIGTTIIALGLFAIILAVLVNIVGGIFVRNWGLGAGYIIGFAYMFAYPASFLGIIFIETSRLMSWIDY
jgi:hypothetical protein